VISPSNAGIIEFIVEPLFTATLGVMLAHNSMPPASTAEFEQNMASDQRFVQSRRLFLNAKTSRHGVGHRWGILLIASLRVIVSVKEGFYLFIFLFIPLRSVVSEQPDLLPLPLPLLRALVPPHAWQPGRE